MTNGPPQGREASETNDPGESLPFADLGGQRLLPKEVWNLLTDGTWARAWARGWRKAPPTHPLTARASDTACLAPLLLPMLPGSLLSHRARLQPSSPDPGLEARLQGGTELSHQCLQAWRRTSCPGSGVLSSFWNQV